MLKRYLLLLLVIPIILSIAGCFEDTNGPKNSSGDFGVSLKGKSASDSEYHMIDCVSSSNRNVYFEAKIYNDFPHPNPKYTYKFNFGNGVQKTSETSSTLFTSYTSYVSAGIYQCKVRVNDDQGEWAQSTIDVWIHGQFDDNSVTGTNKRLDTDGNVLCLTYENSNYSPPNKYRMQVYSVSSLQDPALASTINLPNKPIDVCVYGNYAYVLLETGLLPILISDPAAPVMKTLISITGGLDISHEGSSNYLFIASGANGVKVFSITAPESPVLKHTAVTKKPVNRILIKENTAYCLEENTLEIFSVIVPEMMDSDGTLNLGESNLRDIAVEGTKGFVINNERCFVVDLSNKVQPTLIGTTSSQLNNPCSLGVRENILYIADTFINNYKNYIGVFGVKESGALSFVGNIITPPYQYYMLYIYDQVVFVTSSDRLSAFEAIK